MVFEHLERVQATLPGRCCDALGPAHGGRAARHPLGAPERLVQREKARIALLRKGSSWAFKKKRVPTGTPEDDRGEKAEPRRYALLTLIRHGVGGEGAGGGVWHSETSAYR